MNTRSVTMAEMKADLAATVADLKTAHAGLIVQYRWIATDTIHLDVLAVPKQARNTGVGTLAMHSLTAHARAAGIRIMLVPDSCFGSDLSRLRAFYSRFGFKHVKNRMLFG